VHAEFERDDHRAATHMAVYSVYEARFLKAGGRFQSTTHAQELTAFQRSQAMEMLKAAEDAAADLDQLSLNYPFTAVLVQLRLVCLEQLHAARMLLASNSQAQQDADRAYAEALMGIADWIKGHGDATPELQAQRLVAAALAEFVRAGGTMPAMRELVAGRFSELSPAQRRTAEKMRAATTELREGILKVEEIRARTPEFLSLKLDAYRKSLQIDLLLNRDEAISQHALDSYRSNLKYFYNLSVPEAPTPLGKVNRALCARALAEVEFLRMTSERAHLGP